MSDSFLPATVDAAAVDLLSHSIGLLPLLDLAVSCCCLSQTLSTQSPNVRSSLRSCLDLMLASIALSSIPCSLFLLGSSTCCSAACRFHILFHAGVVCTLLLLLLMSRLLVCISSPAIAVSICLLPLVLLLLLLDLCLVSLLLLSLTLS